MNNDSKKTQSFKSILWESGFHDFSMNGQKEIAEYFCRDPRTIRRWFKGDRAPEWAIKKLTKESKRLNDCWDGFIIQKDSIITPNGYKYTAKQLESLSYQIQLIKSYQK